MYNNDFASPKAPRTLEGVPKSGGQKHHELTWCSSELTEHGVGPVYLMRGAVSIRAW